MYFNAILRNFIYFVVAQRRKVWALLVKSEVVSSTKSSPILSYCKEFPAFVRGFFFVLGGLQNPAKHIQHGSAYLFHVKVGTLPVNGGDSNSNSSRVKLRASMQFCAFSRILSSRKEGKSGHCW